jgi:hypothetical protein
MMNLATFYKDKCARVTLSIEMTFLGQCPSFGHKHRTTKDVHVSYALTFMLQCIWDTPLV